MDLLNKKIKIKWIDGNSRGTINECIFSMCALSKDEGNRKEWTYESKQIMPKKCKEKKIFFEVSSI